ncbi:MAG: hypothetical protein E7448_07585 [Ruminococcaceae bacterium]|nr:hypothetical protein [Oscillospiraceae bacterium]
MNKQTMHKILDLYDRAMEDPDYMALHAEYIPAQRALVDLLERLPEADYEILSNYLQTSVALFYLLLEIVLTAASNS